jgi:hypothetical protein
MMNTAHRLPKALLAQDKHAKAETTLVCRCWAPLAPQQLPPPSAPPTPPCTSFAPGRQKVKGQNTHFQMGLVTRGVSRGLYDLGDSSPCGVILPKKTTCRCHAFGYTW